MPKTVALAGNPNSGKTTLFNALTGANHHVANWPGVTVERKEGQFRCGSDVYTVVDLPGIYSLGAFSEDELVARDYILSGEPDVVVNVIDATNVERNLYLTTQLLEMGANVVVALNMVDEAESLAMSLDAQALSKRLGVPVVPTVASKRQGIDQLMAAAVRAAADPSVKRKLDLSYGQSVDAKVTQLEKLLKDRDLVYPPRWVAAKLLEGDGQVLKMVEERLTSQDVEELRRVCEEAAAENSGLQLEIVDGRYRFIQKVTRGAVARPKKEVPTLTDRLDKVLTHRFWGLPLFAVIIFAVFQLTFVIGQDLLGGLVGEGVGLLGEYIDGLLARANASELLRSYVADGLIGGVGVVLEFIPLIVILYTLMGLLEDSGYMARAAYVMDNTMRKVGLQGKTFIPLIVAFGCNVPGVMATRTLENKKDRMTAILINPFMSCGAKLPIYLAFIAAFFPKYGALVLFSLYVLGVLVALAMGKLFGRTLFKGESSHFIMELPPYRMPTLRNVVRNMWDNVSSFLVRAGTVIFVVVSLLWVLAVLPAGVEPYGSESILGRVGAVIAPIFAPAGFGTWQASVGLFAGVAAKEAVVATLGMVYAGVEEGVELVSALQKAFTPLSAFAFLVMTLLYTPCVATLATIKKETGSAKWAFFSAGYAFAVGWLGAVLVFQLGRLFGLS